MAQHRHRCSGVTASANRAASRRTRSADLRHHLHDVAGRRAGLGYVVHRGDEHPLSRSQLPTAHGRRDVRRNGYGGRIGEHHGRDVRLGAQQGHDLVEIRAASAGLVVALGGDLSCREVPLQQRAQRGGSRCVVENSDRDEGSGAGHDVSSSWMGSSQLTEGCHPGRFEPGVVKPALQQGAHRAEH